MQPENGIAQKLLEALCTAWLEASDPIQIGCDLEKVRLLKEANETLGSDAPVSDDVRYLYQEVFLRDVWKDKNTG